MVYAGRCPRTGAWLQLPTEAAEAAARDLMATLAQSSDHGQEGKMYGVLLATTAAGPPITLKGFSGLLNGQSHREGWVPPIPGRTQVALAEAETLNRLEQLTAEIVRLQGLPERDQLAQQRQLYAEKRRSLADLHQTQKQARQHQRQHLSATRQGDALAAALAELDGGSLRLRGEILRTDGSEALTDEQTGATEDAPEMARAMAAGLLDKAGDGVFDWR